MTVPMERERLEFDVVVVGAGPAGLAAAIRLRQLALEQGREVSVAVIEKGSEVGAHILSGAVMDPRGLDELLPGWRDESGVPGLWASGDRMCLLTRRRAWPLPVPAGFGNHGHRVVGLGSLCRWLAGKAEALGVEIFPGFAGVAVVDDGEGGIAGITTGERGRLRDGTPGPDHQAGVDVLARCTLIAEGCRGSLAKGIEERYQLRSDRDPQVYGLGVKEVWEVAPGRHRPGLVVHTVGWPLDHGTYGGSFLYHLDGNRVAVGLVVGLDYRNPGLSPFEEMQRVKTHPAIRPTFEGGRRIAYGARALNEGGWQSLPRLDFPGGALIGCAAGFLDAARIKGIHTAIKSGMLAAEAAFAALERPEPHPSLAAYPEALRRSWVGEALRRARNVRPGFRWGLLPGLVNAALVSLLFRGREPWTLHHHPDHAALRPRDHCRSPTYPKPDGRLTFDRLSSLALANLGHGEDQPCHLRLRNPEAALRVNHAIFGGPEQFYCPAGVYEFLDDGDGGRRLQINAANCIHCKTCDIKDPGQNIDWVPPQGGDGPNYSDM